MKRVLGRDTTRVRGSVKSYKVLLQLPCCPGKEGGTLRKWFTKHLIQVAAFPSSCSCSFSQSGMKSVLSISLGPMSCLAWLEIDADTPPQHRQNCDGAAANLN